ncbi:MAG: lysozyme [Candidatus Accumulibacter sp.]|uniref:Lysozyme n=1 Tax=Candidatus Accumulibacter proximus TaxID=2954385 RepID=A0A935UGT4_9PROT|nr:lysozyme [Candidatus Accumulibacter proximus]
MSGRRCATPHSPKATGCSPSFSLSSLAPPCHRRFHFNLGAGRLQTSTLRRRINLRDWQTAGKEFRRWIHGRGMVLPGLVARREAEAKLLTGNGGLEG